MPDKNNWTLYSERPPTKDDADLRGEVLKIWGSGEQFIGNWEHRANAVAWQPLPKPPVRKVKKTMERWMVINDVGDMQHISALKQYSEYYIENRGGTLVHLTGEYEVEE